MIIDTTCSVAERRMKEAIEAPEHQIFKVSDFVVDVNMDKNNNFTITIENSFTIGNTFKSHTGWTNVTFNDCVIYNMPNKVMDWDAPVFKFDPDPVTPELRRQLAAMANNPDTVTRASHTALAGLENDDHLQYFLNP